METNISRQLVTLVLLAVLFGACNTDRLGYVAEVNGKKISVDEFTARYDKYREQTSERDNIVLRKQILNNMVNETLILDDLHEHGLDRDSVYTKKYRDIQDQALLDGFAKLLTVDTMSVSQNELYNEFRAYNTKVSARFVYAKTESEAWKLKYQLEHGSSFADLAKKVFADPGLAANGGYLGFFGYGDMEPSFQDTAFSLPVGELSDPVKLRIGYAIIRVEKHVDLPLASEADYGNLKPKLEDAIRKRKMTEYINTEEDKIAKELNPRFNDQTVQDVFDNWRYISQEELVRPVNENRFKKIDDIASLPFMQFGDQSWTVSDFVTEAEKTRPKYRRFVKTTDDLKEFAEGLVSRTVLLQKAREAGLEDEQRVVLQEKLARQNYLLRRWADLAEDSITASSIDDSAAFHFYEQHKDQFMDAPLVNASEILVRTLTEANQLLKEIKEGVDFGMLARTHSIRTYAARRNGELGFAPPSAFGSASEQVVRARVGQILGPLPLDPNFAILKILARKPSRQRTFEQSKDAVAILMLPERKQQAFWEAVNRLRSRARIDLDIEALGNVTVASN